MDKKRVKPLSAIAGGKVGEGAVGVWVWVWVCVCVGGWVNEESVKPLSKVREGAVCVCVCVCERTISG